MYVDVCGIVRGVAGDGVSLLLLLMVWMVFVLVLVALVSCLVSTV